MTNRICLAMLVSTLACMGAAGQVVFDENFDGGYSGSFGTGSYQSGSPTNASVTVLASGGNPNGCAQIQFTATTGSDQYAGQLQLMTVTPNADPNPADYTLSFDASGSRAAVFAVGSQMWTENYFDGSETINSYVNYTLGAANTWQTFTTNLGAVTSAAPTGNTWQFNFQINASQWGGAGVTNILKIDNIILTHLGNDLSVTSSLNPAPATFPVVFTAVIGSNAVAQGNATGQVVFASAAGPFSTNTVSGGMASSVAVSNLPAGTDTITTVYSGGNYPAATNSYSQAVLPVGLAESNLLIFTDNLVNGFQNWSWATVNLAATNPAPHSGAYAISVTAGGYQALALQRNDFNSAPYTALTFWINGGPTGGQKVQVNGLLNGASQSAVALPPLPTNTWQQVTIPLTSLGVANSPLFNGIYIKSTISSSQPVFYVDDIALVLAPAPAVVHLGANASQPLATVDARQFAFNTATWDGKLGDPLTLPLLRQAGTMALRWPGGSTSDDYHWASDPSGNATFRNLATNLGAQVFTTVNYGTGTPAEAAAWVRNANLTNGCNFTYWEIGNECYGSWEIDSNTVAHDPYTYATRAAQYFQQMRGTNPVVPIKLGVVVVPGEGSYANNMNHYAVNPRTGTTNYGWTPVMLNTLSNLGAVPDFVIYHDYPEYTGDWVPYEESPDSDPLVLQVAGTPDPVGFSDWYTASTNLRQQVSDYLGPLGTGVELCATENNSDAGNQGRQSTSVVNALYMADSLAQLMKTQFRSYIWWDLHNGADSTGDFDPTIYGWRANGDLGVLDGNNVPYPTYYAAKLLQFFARPGDAALGSSSDNALLAAYATRRTNGMLTLLVINKDMTTNLTGQIALTNFTPATAATVLSWGLPQDTAAETNGPAAAQDVATNTLTVSANFTHNFQPLSLTLFLFNPSAPALAVGAVKTNSVQLTLSGQPGAQYVVTTSPDLIHWTPVSTNLLTAAATNVTLTIMPGATQQFYSAAWLP